MKQLVEPPIPGLELRLNKVVPDKRGVLCELAPRGLDDRFLAEGLGNIHSSIAVGKGTLRAGHYHRKNVECFFTLSGVALWVFYDWRTDQPSVGKAYWVVTGFDEIQVPEGTDSFFIKKGELAEVRVPSGVYHGYFALSDEPVVVVTIASQQYDPTDYYYPTMDEMPALKQVAQRFGVMG